MYVVLEKIKTTLSLIYSCQLIYADFIVMILIFLIHFLLFRVPAASNLQNLRPFKDFLRPEFGKFKT